MTAGYVLTVTDPSYRIRVVAGRKKRRGKKPTANDDLRATTPEVE